MRCWPSLPALLRRLLSPRFPAGRWFLLGLLAWGGWPGTVLGAEPSSLRLDLPGRVVSAAPASDARLWLLSETEDGPRLHLFVAGEEPRLLLDVVVLPEEVEEIASADCDGDGSADPVALAPGRWWWIRGDPGGLELVELEPRERRSDGRWTGPARKGIIAPASAAPPARAEPGGLEILSGDGEGLEVRRRARLPVSAERKPWGVLLSSPRLRPIPGGWVGWGEAEGPRISAVRITVGGEVRELALEFPGSEQLDEVSVVVLDGELHLLAQSMTGFGLMADKRVRLYPLSAPSGAAVPPILEDRLEIHTWQDAEAVAGDVDGDGLQDLVLLAPPGMGEGRLGIWTFRRRAGGGFESPDKTVRGLEGASFEGEHDLDGDGRPDLVLLHRDSVAVYPGRPGPGVYAEVAPVRGIVDLPREPREDSEPASATGRRSSTGHGMADVDGDGVMEVVFWSSGEAGSTVLVVSYATR